MTEYSAVKEAEGNESTYRACSQQFEKQSRVDTAHRSPQPHHSSYHIPKPPDNNSPRLYHARTPPFWMRPIVLHRNGTHVPRASQIAQDKDSD
jgi:hypothetical protein